MPGFKYFRISDLGAKRAPKQPVDQFVGHQLQAFRQRSGRSQQDLADLLLIPVTDVPKFEAGRKRIKAAQLFVLARHFGVPVAVFFGIELAGA